VRTIENGVLPVADGDAVVGPEPAAPAVSEYAMGRTTQPYDVEFDAFVRGQVVGLTGFGRLLAGDDARAEDLVAEALARTYLRWRRSGPPDDPLAYVRRAMVNHQSTLWRRLLSRESFVPVPEAASVAAIDHDLRLAVWTVLRSLPPRQRAVVILRYYEGLTETEVARELDCSVGTVKSQCSKALAKLRVDPSMLAVRSEQEDE
jgi:RNA polymerase sigma-70 factor (sigma-E family)